MLGSKPKPSGILQLQEANNRGFRPATPQGQLPMKPSYTQALQNAKRKVTNPTALWHERQYQLTINTASFPPLPERGRDLSQSHSTAGNNHNIQKTAGPPRFESIPPKASTRKESTQSHEMDVTSAAEDQSGSITFAHSFLFS